MIFACFFAWRSCSALTPDVVRSWAWVQWRQRFVVGTMSLDKADDNVFTGLQVAWDGAYISLRPCTSDPWAAHCYGETDNFPLKPWQSWAPPQQFKTAVRGLLCIGPGMSPPHVLHCAKRYGRFLWHLFIVLTSLGISSDNIPRFGRCPGCRRVSCCPSPLFFLMWNVLLVALKTPW